MGIILKSIFTFCLLLSNNAEANNSDFVEKSLEATTFLHVTRSNEDVVKGAGTIITKSGIILTNYHIIHKAEKIRVWLYNNKQEYSGEVIGSDPIADLAIVRIDAKNDLLRPIEFEYDNGKIIHGDVVYSTGHPLNLKWSITKGIINHTDRYSNISPYIRLIQHTAEITKGNSGGPLINESGKLIGINTYVTQDRYTKIGYAIKMNIILESLVYMISNEPINRPALHINGIEMNSVVMERLKKSNIEVSNILGILVNRVEKGSWPEQQGIKLWDIIISVDNQPINNMDDLILEMRFKKPNELVTLLVVRKGVVKKIEYRLDRLKFSNDFYDKKSSEISTQKNLIYNLYK